MVKLFLILKGRVNIMKTEIKQKTEDISILIQKLTTKFTELKYSYNDNLNNDLASHQIRNVTQVLELIDLEISNCLNTVERTLQRNIFSLIK